MVLGSRDNHQAAISLPAGTIIEIVGSARDERFVRIRVGLEEFEAFQTDVEDRCRLKGNEDPRQTQAATQAG